MPRTNKPKSVVESVETVVAPVTPVASVAPVVSKKSKKTVVESSPAPVVAAVVEPVIAPKTKKSKKVVAEVASSPAIVEPIVGESSDPVVASVEASVAEQTLEYLAKLQQATVILSTLKAEFRSLEKKWTRDLKVAQKQSTRNKRKAGNRAPSGFVKPTRISDELASFLGKETGTEMARTAVTRDINLYIRNNNLQDKSNGRKIIPDDKLASLLKLQKTDELTYFNLQRYMSPHFTKKAVEVVAIV